jgi:serine protease Do
MKQQTTKRTRIAVLALVAIALVAPSLAFSAGRAERTSGTSTAPSTTATAPASNPQALAEAAKNLETIQLSFREVAKKVLPVVVEIDVTEVVSQSQSQSQSPFDWFFNQTPGNNRGGDQQFRRSGLGSGIIVQKAGDTYYVLTNNHVVDSATDVTVKLADQQVFKAKVVGKDSKKDLAVVSFSASGNLTVADLGDSDVLQVGDLVLAVGNPLGFENTVTMGIVSALGRTGPSGTSQNTDYIQTDASINQGNSGGALVNVYGEVIGINSWIAAPTGGSVGLGFAIPINNAKKTINDLITKKKVEYGFLGVQPTDPTVDSYPGVAKDLKIENVKGALVVNVYKGQPGEKAGILPGDYITKVNGVDIANTSKLIQVVGDLLADKAYDFELIRYGEKTKLSIKLAVRPEDGSEATSYKNLWPGMTVVHINDQLRQQDSNVPKGIDGVAVGYVAADTADNQSPAAIAGFRPYDVISQINGKDIKTVMDYYKAINDKTKSVSFKINRNGTDVTIGLTK